MLMCCVLVSVVSVNFCVLDVVSGIFRLLVSIVVMVVESVLLVLMKEFGRCG